MSLIWLTFGLVRWGKLTLPFIVKKYGHHSRIDYFLVDQELLAEVEEVKHVPAILSDHSAVFLSLRHHYKSGMKRWTLDRTILLVEGVVSNLKDKTAVFFQANIGSAKIQIIWDTFKAYLRAIASSIMVGKRRALKQEDEDRINEIKAKECDLQKASLEGSSRVSVLNKDIELLQAEYPRQFGKRILARWKVRKLQHFAYGERCSSLLA